MKFIGSLPQAKAEKKRQEVEFEQAKHTSRGASPLLYDWAKLCMREWQGTLKTSSFSNYKNAYEARIHGQLGGIRIDQITAPNVSEWLHTLIKDEGNTGAVYKAYQTLRRMLSIALKQQLIAFNPADAVPYPARTKKKPRRSRDRVLTMKQYRLLLDACDKPQHRLLIRFATELGPRRGELCGIQFSDVATTAAGVPYLHIRRAVSQNEATNGVKEIDTPKNGRDRKVAMTEDLHDEFQRFFLWQHVAVGATEESYVWAGKIGRTGKLRCDIPAAPHSLADMLERRLHDAGLVDSSGKALTTLHGLRATGATFAAAAGVNPFVIQHQLGHSELRVTQESYLGAPAPDLLAPYAAVFS